MPVMGGCQTGDVSFFPYCASELKRTLILGSNQTSSVDQYAALSEDGFPGPRPGRARSLQGTGTTSVSPVPSAEMPRRSSSRLRPASSANAVITSPF